MAFCDAFDKKMEVYGAVHSRHSQSGGLGFIHCRNMLTKDEEG